MTVSTLINRVDYTGNGSTTVYAVPFPFFAGSDLDVYVDGVLQTLTTHYTVAIVRDVNGAFSSANLTFLTAPANTKPVAIVRDVPLTQTVSTTNNSQLLPSIVEKALDRATLVNQDTLARLSRAFQLVPSASGDVIISPEDGKYLAWEGTSLVNKTATEMAADAGSGVAAQVVTNTANIATNTADIATLFQNGTSPWNASRTYVAGNVVNYTGSLWLCLVGNTNSAPTLFNANWERVQSGFSPLTRDAIQGTTPVWASGTTLTMGSLNCMDSLRTTLITCASTTLNFGTTGLNGLDAGSIASNTWYYIYAILNPTTLATGYLASTSATAPTMPSGFTIRRLLTAVTTLAGSAVLDNVAWFNWGNKHTVQYDNTTADKVVLSGGNATSFTTVSASAVAPVGATYLFLGIYEGTSNGDRQLYLRRTGSGVSTGRRVHNFYDDHSAYTNAYYVPAEIGLNSSRQFDYRVSGTGVGSTIWATGYIMEV
jgi:hypothetical protein